MGYEPTGRVGYHRQDDIVHGPGMCPSVSAGMSLVEGFDWSFTEDPAGELMEAVAGLSRNQAEHAIRWMDEAKAEAIAPIRAELLADVERLEAVLDWIDNASISMEARNNDKTPIDRNGRGETRVGLRAEVALRELRPNSKAAELSMRDMSIAFGVTHQNVHRVTQSFRAAFGIK